MKRAGKKFTLGAALDLLRETVTAHPMVKELRRAQRRYEEARARLELMRGERDTAVLAAIDQGFTHDLIVEALDGAITRGRVGQISVREKADDETSVNDRWCYQVVKPADNGQEETFYHAHFKYRDRSRPKEAA